MRQLSTGAAVLVATAVLSAQAPTQTMNLLTRANRQGTITSASTTIPADVQGIQIDGDIPAADASDPQNVVTVRVQVSADGGATWQVAFSYRWEGGIVVNKFTGQEGPRPLSFAFGPIDHMAGWLVRGELDIQRTMRIGLNLTINPPGRVE